jgi:hypothetical protein
VRGRIGAEVALCILCSTCACFLADVSCCPPHLAQVESKAHVLALLSDLCLSYLSMYLPFPARVSVESKAHVLTLLCHLCLPSCSLQSYVPCLTPIQVESKAQVLTLLSDWAFPLSKHV